MSEASDSGLGTLDIGPQTLNWEGPLFRFLAQALTHLGHRPRLGACVACGRPPEGTGGVRFNAHAGGAVCDRCPAGEGAAFRLRRETLVRLDALCEPGAPAPPGPLPSPLRQELRAALQGAWTYLLERPSVAMAMLP